MRRSFTPLVLGAALIALPAGALAQTPAQQPPAQPPATASPTQAPATQQPPAQNRDQAAEHLAKAKAALNEIDTTSVTGAAKTRLTELKRHVSALDRAAAAPAAGKSRAKGAERSWATDVAAIDRILTELTTPATSAADPATPAGTAGRAQAAAVDEATRAKLLVVQKHITAYASAMSGTAAAPAAEPAADPAATQPPTTQPPATTQPPPAAQPPATQPPPTTQPPTTQPPATQPPAAQPPTTTPADPSTAATTPTADPEAARRLLTEARDVLSTLTQLPEAAALTGEARTQVTELITNFNELITTQTEWRASYAKVQANLTALIGAEATDEANVPPPATGTAGAVGTSGMTTIDPKVREKLIEFRAKLVAFEKGVGGGESKK